MSEWKTATGEVTHTRIFEAPRQLVFRGWVRRVACQRKARTLISPPAGQGGWPLGSPPEHKPGVDPRVNHPRRSVQRAAPFETRDWLRRISHLKFTRSGGRCGQVWEA